MYTNKTITIALIAAIIVLASYAIIKKTSHVREIKRLTKEAQSTVDSLATIQKKYKVLHLEYERIYGKFDSTRNEFNTLRKSIDSVMKSNINNLSKLNQDLKKVLNSEKPISKVDTAKSNFAFNL